MKIKSIQNNRIGFFFKEHEYICAAFFLWIILIACFNNVIFFNSTFMTSPITPGTMPTGPYGYTSNGVQLMVIDPGAPAWQDEPTHNLVSKVYLSGNIPLWNPYIALGTPLAASAISAVFFPLNFIIYLMPHSLFGQAFDLTILLKLFIAGFFTYCFMREFYIGRWGSFTSAVAFMLNGYFIFYLNMVHLNIEVLVPLLLFIFERLIKTQDFKHIVFAGIVLAISILGGMPESTLFALFLAVTYYIFRIWFRIKGDLVFSKQKFFSSLISVFFIGGLLSGFFTYPVIEFLTRSWNAHTGALGLLGEPFKNDTISIIIPYFFGWIHYTWNGLSQHAILPYVGIVTVFLAGCAVLVRNEHHKIGLFFGCFAIFYLLKTYSLPVINLIGYLPLFNVAIFPKYLFPEFAFSLAVMAGIGIQNIWDNKVRLFHTVVISSVLLVIISVFLYVNIPAILASEKIWKFSIFNSVTWVMLMTGFAIFFILLLSVLFFIQKRKQIDSRYLAIILIIFLILELFIYIPHIRSTRYDPFTTPPYIDYLKNDTDTFRVVGINNILYPDTASAYSIFDIRQLDAIYVNRYMSFIKRNIDPSVVDRVTGEKVNFSYKNGRFLDLLGVKYILSSIYLNSSQNNGLIDDIITHGNVTTSNKQFVSKSQFNGKNVLFEHPPSEINYQMQIPVDADSLDFCMGMDQNVWSPEKGDGVEFDIYTNQSGEREKTFSKYIDPKNNPADQKWYCGAINLSQYQNTTVNISFVTLPGPSESNSYDWAGWSDLSLKSNSSESLVTKFNQRYELVYDKEIKIYKNNNVFPRSFIVHNAEVIKDEKKILDRLDDTNFDLRNSIIIEKDVPPQFINRIFVDNSTADITEYNYNSVELQANMKSDGFLILSDTYYPGWRAYIDGNETEIYEADYFLRAVHLEKGTHYIVFKYMPETFWLGLYLSFATVVIIAGYFTLRFIRKKLIGSDIFNGR